MFDNDKMINSQTAVTIQEMTHILIKTVVMFDNDKMINSPTVVTIQEITHILRQLSCLIMIK